MTKINEVMGGLAAFEAEREALRAKQQAEADAVAEKAKSIVAQVAQGSRTARKLWEEQIQSMLNAMEEDNALDYLFVRLNAAGTDASKTAQRDMTLKTGGGRKFKVSILEVKVGSVDDQESEGEAS